jgi:formamidopyrimidine-DNA glycosylase
MPELPEVETARRFVEHRALGHKSLRAEVADLKMLEGVMDDLTGLCCGSDLVGTARHGKNLFLDLGRGFVRIHLSMSGSLHFLGAAEGRTRHERFRMVMDHGSLVLDDPRRFGRFGFVRSVDGFVADRGLGPDVLGLADMEIAQRLGARRGAVKPILLDQRVLAGVGNLYADEALFQSGLHPRTLVRDMPPGAGRLLGRKVREVMIASIEQGTDFEGLPAGFLLRRRAAREACPRCGDALRTDTVGGRTTIFCGSCQKLPFPGHGE